MDSNVNQSFSHSNTGLLRYRSAPSSLFDSNSEPGRPFSRFAGYGSELESSLEFRDSDDKSAVTMGLSNRRFASSGLPPHYPRQAPGSFENGGLGLATSMAMESGDQIQRHAKSVGSSLVRKSSSPPGLFANVSASNGYGELGPTTNRLKSQMSFSSRLSSNLGMISEAESESLGANGTVEEKLGNGNADARFYGNGFTFSSWNEPLNFTDNFGAVRRDHESNRKLCSSYQDEDLGSRIHVLSHHLNLPKNSGEMAMEKFLHFQDSVPCKVRAKRGCATHPRSIAERVRRTRISERMRKLQELVPNMDKQTNTADMLDLAVDYIKDLQKQFKNLSDNRANCKCLNKQKPIQNQLL